MACDEKALSPDDQTFEIDIWLHGERENRLKTSKVYFLLNFHCHCALTLRTCTIAEVLHVFICFLATFAPKCIFVSYKRIFLHSRGCKSKSAMFTESCINSQHAQKRLKCNNNRNHGTSSCYREDIKKFGCKAHYAVYVLESLSFALLPPTYVLIKDC